MKNAFVDTHPEKLTMNQYWFSPGTIQIMVEELEEHATRVAFLSTPSVYFSLRSGELKRRSRLFDVSLDNR